MLSRLQVRNYVLIDSLDITFPEGLVIITGQTGAGKSILLGSIALALGSKADASVIGENGDKCVVEAEFEADPDDPVLRSLVGEMDADWDDGHLILRRMVGKTSRARAFVNDTPVTASSLQALAGRLIDIHSQHQTLRLSDGKFRLSVLDHYAGNAALLEECSAAWSACTSALSELEELRERIARSQERKEYNEARYRQLESASLREGELEALEAEQRQLANAEEIKGGLYAVENLFSDDDQTGRMSLDSVLREAGRKLEKISSYVPQASALSERIEASRVELDDVLSEVSSLGERMSFSPERLSQVEDRLSLLYSLMQKFGCSDEAQLIACRDSLSGELFDTTAAQERLEVLTARLDSLKKNYDEICARLHSSRALAALPFARAIEDSLRGLELQNAVFSVEIRPSAPGSSGKDSAVFLFSSTGRNPVEVEKCASGGELSRIMLCLKDMMARYTKMPTMVFDEIDTGVSGSVADKIGSLICSMGENMQVFAITHLPQVAAKGLAHYLVSKQTDEGGNTSTTIKKLSDDQRVLEVARMLSGSEITEAAIANAKSLLGKLRD